MEGARVDQLAIYQYYDQEKVMQRRNTCSDGTQIPSQSPCPKLHLRSFNTEAPGILLNLSWIMSPLLRTFQPRPILLKGKAQVLPYLTMFWMAWHSLLIPCASPPPPNPLWPENASTHQLQALSITPLPGYPEPRPPSSSFFSSRSPQSALGEAFWDSLA